MPAIALVNCTANGIQPELVDRYT